MSCLLHKDVVKQQCGRAFGKSMYGKQKSGPLLHMIMVISFCGILTHFAVYSQHRIQAFKILVFKGRCTLIEKYILEIFEHKTSFHLIDLWMFDEPGRKLV